MPKKERDPVKEWDTQKTNVFNQNSGALDTFDSGINPGAANTFYHGTHAEFKHAISIPKAEITKCANQFLKYKANNSQNQLAVNPGDVVFNKAFLNSQIEYRDWRGKQISEGLDSYDIPAGVLFDYIGVEGGPVQPPHPAQYKVEFFTTNEADKGMDPAVAYTHYKDVRLEDLQAADILEIIKGAKIDDGNAQFSAFPKTVVDSLIAGLDKDWGFEAIRGNTYKKGYFTHIGAEAKTDGRYAFKTGDPLAALRVNGAMHAYRFDINKFIPTKSKIYQNPKVVQKMALDILHSPFPAMHADLSISYENQKDKTLNWTIHKIYPNHHTAIHLTYISEDDGLYNLPDTLPAIKDKYQSKIDANCCNSNRSAIDAKMFMKKDDLSMTALHCYRTRQSLLEMSHDSSGREYGERDETSTSNCGFIYEYWPDYTVIASTIIKPYLHHNFNCTSYTIIHWNPDTNHTKFTKKERAPANYESKDRLKTVEDVMNRLQVRVEGLDTGYNQLLPMQQYRLEVKDNHPLGYFIPGILDLGYAKGETHDTFRDMGGYLIPSLNFQTKIVLEHHRHKLELELLTHILPHFNINSGNAFKDLSALVLGTFAEKLGNNKTEYIPVYPGFLGYMLGKIHGNPTAYNAAHLIPHIKKWTVDWAEFLTGRGIIYHRSSSKASDLIKLVAEIEDRNTVRRKLEKKQGANIPSHPRALPRPTMPWRGTNNRTGGVLQGRELPQAQSYADRVQQDASSMGFDSYASQVFETQDAADYRQREHGMYTSRPGERVNMVSYTPGYGANRGPYTHGASRARDKGFDKTFRSQFTAGTHELDFAPLKMQAEIDTLKRTLNELTLRALPDL